MYGRSYWNEGHPEEDGEGGGEEREGGEGGGGGGRGREGRESDGAVHIQQHTELEGHDDDMLGHVVVRTRSTSYGTRNNSYINQIDKNIVTGQTSLTCYYTSSGTSLSSH